MASPSLQSHIKKPALHVTITADFLHWLGKEKRWLETGMDRSVQGDECKALTHRHRQLNMFNSSGESLCATGWSLF